MKTVAFLLFSIVVQVQATVVTYKEGAYQIPNEMREMPAEQIKETFPQASQFEQFRAFTQYYPETRSSVVVYSFLQPTSDEASFHALRNAGRNLERTKEEMQKEIEKTFGNTGSIVTDVQVDLAKQQVLATLASEQDAVDVKLGLVPLNNGKLFGLAVVAGKVVFAKLSATLEKIPRSLEAYPQFRLSEDSEVKLGIVILLFVTPTIWGFLRRKMSRWRILCVNFVAPVAAFFVFLVLPNGGFLHSALYIAFWILILLWAMFGRVEGGIPTA
jgi:hypothetical protein